MLVYFSKKLRAHNVQKTLVSGLKDEKAPERHENPNAIHLILIGIIACPFTMVIEKAVVF